MREMKEIQVNYEAEKQMRTVEKISQNDVKKNVKCEKDGGATAEQCQRENWLNKYFFLLEIGFGTQPKFDTNLTQTHV